jgi:hypothetical protein
MMKRSMPWFYLLALFALGGVGCKRSVPTNIVEQSMRNALRSSPTIPSAMCGVQVKGFATTTVSNIQRGENNVGSAHLVGKPWPGTGLPAQCEGDVKFQYSYTSKTTGSRKRRKTNVTWYLDKLELTAVQTPNVQLKAGVADDKLDDSDDGQ